MKKWRLYTENYVKKVLKYFSMSDSYGSVVFWDKDINEMRAEYHEKSSPVVISLLRMLSFMEPHEAGWEILRIYNTETGRLSFDFLFDFNPKFRSDFVMKIREKEEAEIEKLMKKKEEEEEY